MQYINNNSDFNCIPSINKNIELISVIQTLNKYWDNLLKKMFNTSMYKSKYLDNINKHFANYIDHNSIKLYRTIANDVINFGAFTQIILHYTMTPEIKKETEYDFSILSSFTNQNLFNEFINEVNEFHSKSNFNDFYQSNAHEHKMLLDDFENDLDISDTISFINIYFRSSIHNSNYNIYIAPQIMGNYCFEITDQAEENTINLIFSPYDKNEKYYYGTTEERIENIWHEIGHSFINKLNELSHDKLIQNINDSLITTQLKKQGYIDILTIINETIIRAATVRLFELKGYEKYANYLLNNYIKNGYSKINEIVSYLKDYEKETLIFSDYYLKYFYKIINIFQNINANQEDVPQ